MTAGMQHRRRRYCLEDVLFAFVTLQLEKPHQAFVLRLETVYNNSKILPQGLLTSRNLQNAYASFHL